MENKAKTNEKNYYLVVSKEGCVMECWANKASELFGIGFIYDENERPNMVDFIVDVEAENIISIKRKITKELNILDETVTETITIED